MRGLSFDRAALVSLAASCRRISLAQGVRGHGATFESILTKRCFDSEAVYLVVAVLRATCVLQQQRVHSRVVSAHTCAHTFEPPTAKSATLLDVDSLRSPLQCPRGTPTAMACSSGRYSNATNLASEQQCRTCTLGHSCLLGSSEPEPCRAGRYGATPGVTSRECSGSCIKGHFCIAGSTSNTSGVCRAPIPSRLFCFRMHVN